MARKKFNRTLQKIGGKLETSVYCILAGLTIFFMMVSVIIINPIVVWVIALIWPKTAADLSYRSTSGALNLIVVLPFTASKWIWRFLPWRCRKYYIKKGIFTNFPFKDRVRFCGEVDKDVFKMLTYPEQIKVFDTYPEMHEYCVEQGMKLYGHWFGAIVEDGLLVKYALKTDLAESQWEMLLGDKNAYGDAVCSIVNQRTPSEQVIMMMADRAKDWLYLLLNILKKHGIARYSINPLLDKLSPEQRESAKTALEIHRQVVEIKGFANSWGRDPEKSKAKFIAYLLREKAIGALKVEAQAAMTAEQYKVFHEANFSLDPEAAWLILNNGSWDLIRAMFELEKDHGLYKQEALDLVRLDAELSGLLIETEW